MLKLIHRFQKTIIVYIVIFILSASMLVFGVDAIAPRQSSYAIKIDDLEVPYDEFANQRRLVEQQYRSRFGNMVNQLIDTGALNLNQETLDRLVPSVLLRREAEQAGYLASPIEVKKQIEENFTADTYRSFLRTRGLSAQSFEQDLGVDLQVKQLTDFFSAMSTPSVEELSTFIREQQTTRDIQYLSFQVDDFKNAVGEVAQEEIEQYFVDNNEQFEVPAMLSYSYIVVDPKSVEDKVEIVEEDLEFYYAENERKYSIPAKVNLKQIFLSVDSSATDEQKTERKQLAEEALGKAIAGEDFATLVSQYSDDVNTNLLGGDMGWVSKGELGSTLEKAAFALEGPGLSEIVETSEGFHILKIEEYKSESVKALEDVRTEIEQEIRKREAPAYAAIVAQDLFDTWSGSGKNLAEFFSEANYEVKNSEKSTANQDPNPQLRGLTAYLLTTPEEQYQMVERGDSVVLAHITGYEERHVPKIELVKSDVVSKIKNEKAKGLARQAAEAFKTSAAGKGFDKYAKEKSLKLSTKKDVKLPANLPTELNSQEGVDYLVNTWKAKDSISPVINIGDKFSIYEITAVNTPKQKDADLVQTKSQLNSQLASVASLAFVNHRKTQLDIEIDPGLLAQ